MVLLYKLPSDAIIILPRTRLHNNGYILQNKDRWTDMIEKVNITWNDNYQLDGMMYFAQRIIEMLSFNTIDIFRVPLMNTSSLITEYLTVCHGVSPEYHSEQVFEEFKSSFINDIVLNHALGENRIKRIIDRLNREPNKREEIMEYLRHLISPKYLCWTKDFILTVVPQNKDKRKIERSIRCLLPELLNCGYSRDEIYHYTKQVFWSETDDPSKLLSYFLDHYDLKKHSFTVYFAIEAELNEYTSIFEKYLDACFEDDGYFNRLDLKPGFIAGKIEKVVAIDAGKAALQVYSDITYFISYYSFLFDNTKNLLQSATYVVNEETLDARRIIANHRRINLYPLKLDSNTCGEITERCVVSLASKAQCAVRTTDKIINLHNSAISNNGLENSLLNFWSILEIICVRDSHKSKITQVIDAAVPILQRDYLRKYITDIADNLQLILDQDALDPYLLQIEQAEDYEEKIACLILLPEYSSLLDGITDEMARYPVIRSRMLTLHDNYKKRNELYALAEEYGKRVRWHLARIYRARNQITHSGTKPKYLKDLGEHLHSYVDSLTYEVIYKLAIGNLCNLSNVLTDCSLLIEEEKEYMKEAKEIDIDMIRFVISKNAMWAE